LCYFGNGFTQEGVYRLPIHLRNFYYKQLIDTKKREQEDVKQSQKSKSAVSGPNVNVRR